MRLVTYRVLLLVILGLATLPLKAQDSQVIDKIVAVVNGNIILKSDVDERVRQVLQSQQDLKFSKDLWFNVLKSSVDNYVLLEQAKLDSIEVTDAQVDRELDNRFNNIAAQFGGIEALEEQWGKSVLQLKNEYREQIKEEIIISQLQSSKAQGIDITRSEVIKFFESIPTDSLPTVPESVKLAHIVIKPKAKKEADQKAYELATTLRDSILTYGKTIEELAKKYSTGPSAKYGGKLPMMKLTDLIPEYSAAAAALKPGDISKVVRTTEGYHVIRLDERKSDRIATHHILIGVNQEELDEQTAIDELASIRDSVLTNEEITFADMAAKYSEDESTASYGGTIFSQNGQEIIPLTQLDPSLYRIALLLNRVGDISEPKQYTTGTGNTKKAYRIVMLEKKVEEHRANLEKDYKMFENWAKQNKTQRVLMEWLQDLQSKMYIEYRIDMPDMYLTTK